MWKQQLCPARTPPAALQAPSSPAAEPLPADDGTVMVQLATVTWLRLLARIWMESTTSSSSLDICDQLASNRGIGQGGLLKFWQQERAEEDLLSAHPTCAPLAWPSHVAPAEGCPAEELPCQSTAWWGKCQCPRLRNVLANRQEESSIPQHCCLPPASCPLLSSVGRSWGPSLGCPKHPQHSGITPTLQDPHCQDAWETWSWHCAGCAGSSSPAQSNRIPSLTRLQWIHHNHLAGMLES